MRFNIDEKVINAFCADDFQHRAHIIFCIGNVGVQRNFLLNLLFIFGVFFFVQAF